MSRSSGPDHLLPPSVRLEGLGLCVGLAAVGVTFAWALHQPVFLDPELPPLEQAPDRFVQVLMPQDTPTVEEDSEPLEATVTKRVTQEEPPPKELAATPASRTEQPENKNETSETQQTLAKNSEILASITGTRGTQPSGQQLHDLFAHGEADMAVLEARTAGVTDIGARPDISSGQRLKEHHGVEVYTHHGVNEMTLVEDDPQSTFSVDVDTASYAIARRKLESGRLPPPSAVRVEEFVNYFDYHYVGPTGDAPFAVNMEAAPSPWTSGHHVLRVGVQGRRIEASQRKPARLTFLVDVSGSMSRPDKIGYVTESLTWLTSRLSPEDSVAIVTYAGRSDIVLPPTSALHTSVIHAAIARMRTGGGTAMGSGVNTAYELARDAYVDGAENRVIVLSDGDANIGPDSHGQLLELIADHAGEGITLSTVGFGTGNYKDTLMEQFADKGDGNYHYIDSMQESRRVFGERLSGTIETIARDVKIQVDFEPEAVIAYRLLGYENRDIADEDFRNDAVDAGEIGSGHSVTALYDVVLQDGWAANPQRRLATVRLRAKKPGRDRAAEEWRTHFPARLLAPDLADTSKGFRVALSAATFAEKLRRSRHVDEVSYTQIARLLNTARRAAEEEDDELLALVHRAGLLAGESSLGG